MNIHEWLGVLNKWLYPISLEKSSTTPIFALFV